MKNFSVYPKRWNLKTTDKNIDHRRVANLMKFLKENKNQLILLKIQMIIKLVTL
ncbi:MAG: DUF1287 domain-containing protein [Saprospirales bacterium]|nr:DUF1287 domain-containing protein [Saprospirales bacterium]